MAALCAANSKKELLAALTTGVNELGFNSFNLAVLKTDKRQFMTEPTLTSWTWDDLSHYDDSQWYLRDPLLDYAVAGGDPLAWTIKYWDEQPQYAEYAQYIRGAGLLSGVTVPLLCQRAEISAITALSFHRDSFDADSTRALQILGEVAAQRSCDMGIIRTASQAEVNVLRSFSEQQLTILDWARAGKSNADIAVITKRSKRSVDYHMSEILRRLKVSSRSQAIAIYCGM